MRQLKFPDVFAFARMMKKIGIKEEIKKISEKSDEAESTEALGIELLWAVIDKATEEKAEKEIYKFLAEPFEMTASEVENLDLSELLDKLKQLAAENNIKSFFSSAAALMKSN